MIILSEENLGFDIEVSEGEREAVIKLLGRVEDMIKEFSKGSRLDAEIVVEESE